jgi:hypothetical protein
MATTEMLHRIRPGTSADLTVATDVYMQSFDKETLLDFMFPSRHTDSTPFREWVTRRFRLRYWTPGYVLTMLDDAKGRTVAFTWWHITDDSLSFRERWLSFRKSLHSVSANYRTIHSNPAKTKT